MMLRKKLLRLAVELDITDSEAGEGEWAAYLTDTQIADAIVRMRPDSTSVVQGIIDAEAAKPIAGDESWSRSNGPS
jgi:hypothetical protein